MMKTQIEFTKVKDKLPPSAREIYLLLVTEKKGLTTKEVITRVTYASRTVRYALKQLVTMGLIRKIPYLRDMRQSKYLIPKIDA